MRSQLSTVRKLSLALSSALALTAGVLCVQTAQAAPFEAHYMALVAVGQDVYATSIDSHGERYERLLRVGSVGESPNIAKVGQTWYVTTNVGETHTVRRFNVSTRTLRDVLSQPATRQLVDGSSGLPFTVAKADPNVDVEHAEAKVLRGDTFSLYGDAPLNAVVTHAQAHNKTLCVVSGEGRLRVMTYTFGETRARTYVMPAGATAEALACTNEGPLVAGGNGHMETHSAGASTLPSINISQVGNLRTVSTFGRAQQVAAHGKDVLVASAYNDYSLIASVETTGRVSWTQTLAGVTRVVALRSTGDGALVAAGNTLYRIHNIARKVEMENLDGEILALA